MRTINQTCIMTYVRRCVIIGCCVKATYGPKNTTVMLCRQHKMKGMVDQTHTKCCVKGCIRYPIYESSKWELCTLHREYSTINITMLGMFVVNSKGKVLFTKDATKEEIIAYRTRKINVKKVYIPVVKPVVEPIVFVDAFAGYEIRPFDISTPMQITSFEMELGV